MLETNAFPYDVDALKARLDKQLRDRFGSSAEGIEQLQLMLEDLEITRSADAPAADLPGTPKDKPGRLTCRAVSSSSKWVASVPIAAVG